MSSNIDEIWKDDIDYPDHFQISNHGRVYSKRINKILIQGTTKTGYKVISSKIGGRSGRYICVKVHRMLAKAFIINPENKELVNHKDGDKTNNHISNLEWCTSKENTRHAYDNGLIKTKIYLENPLFKLTKQEIEYINTHYKPRHKLYGQRALGRKFNVSHVVIGKIVNNYYAGLV